MLQTQIVDHKYRAIFISDVHLGTKRAQAEALLDLLAKTESDYLYLVGDINDSWSLKKTWFWRQLHNDVIQKILRKARKGTRVIYIPGNHDENFREFVGLRFGKVAVLEEAIHITTNGNRYLVLCGDKFDSVDMDGTFEIHSWRCPFEIKEDVPAKTFKGFLEDVPITANLF